MLWRPSAPPAGFIEPCLPTLANLSRAGRSGCTRSSTTVTRPSAARAIGSILGTDAATTTPTASQRSPTPSIPEVKSVTLDGEANFAIRMAWPNSFSFFGALGREDSRRASSYAFDVFELDGRDLPIGRGSSGGRP